MLWEHVPWLNKWGSKEVAKHLREIPCQPQFFQDSLIFLGLTPKYTGGRSVQSILYSQLESYVYYHFQTRQSKGFKTFVKYLCFSLSYLSPNFSLACLLIPCIPGVLFYLSSAVNPIIYNLLSRRFRAAFRNVLTPSCKQRHSQNHPQGPSVQQNIRKMFFLMSECHLVELTEDVGPQFPCQLSICSSHFPTALCAGQALRKELSKSWHSSMAPH